MLTQAMRKIKNADKPAAPEAKVSDKYEELLNV